MFIIGLLVKFTDPRLLGATKSSTLDSTATSPFVISLKDAKIPALPSIFNFLIALTVMSVANSSSFGSTRALSSMASNGTAFKWLRYVNMKGRPMKANAVTLRFACLTFFTEASFKSQVFEWLLSLSGISVIMT